MAVFDLALDEDTGAPFLEDGDLALITDPLDDAAQRLRVTLRTVVGEWFLDKNHGVDYFGIVLGKGAQQARVETEFRDKILGVEGVKSLTKFEADYEPTTRRFRLVFTCDTDFGEIEEDVTVPPEAPIEPEPPPEPP